VAQVQERREHACPQCGSHNITRVPRRGVFDWLVSWIGRRVYLCLACRHPFYDRPSTE
jgi:DNA-directed RNA polymerase subunit RPC12/RpoP